MLCSFEGPWPTVPLAPCASKRAGLERFPVALAWGKHLFPFRTEQLSPTAPMVLGLHGPGRVGRRRFFTREPPLGGSSSLKGERRNGGEGQTARMRDCIARACGSASDRRHSRNVTRRRRRGVRVTLVGSGARNVTSGPTRGLPCHVGRLWGEERDIRTDARLPCHVGRLWGEERDIGTDARLPSHSGRLWGRVRDMGADAR